MQTLCVQEEDMSEGASHVHLYKDAARKDVFLQCSRAVGGICEGSCSAPLEVSLHEGRPSGKHGDCLADHKELEVPSAAAQWSMPPRKSVL